MRSTVSVLNDIVGEARLLDGSAVADRATSYWNPASMQAKALVMPSTTDDAAQVLRHCNTSGQSPITHGGLTNCVTAVEPGLDDIVLSTEKMTDVVEIDTIGGTAVVEAGTVLRPCRKPPLRKACTSPSISVPAAVVPSAEISPPTRAV